MFPVSGKQDSQKEDCRVAFTTWGNLLWSDVCPSVLHELGFCQHIQGVSIYQDKISTKLMWLMYKSRNSVVLWIECNGFLILLLATTHCFPLIIKYPFNLTTGEISFTPQSARSYKMVNQIKASPSFIAHPF